MRWPTGAPFSSATVKISSAAFDDVVDRVDVVEQERAVRADFDLLAFLLDPPRLLGHAGGGRHDERVPDLVLA